MRVSVFIEMRFGLIDEVHVFIDPNKAKAAYDKWCQVHGIVPHHTETLDEHDGTYFTDLEVQ